MKPFTILVTGHRAWPLDWKVREALDEIAVTIPEGRRIIVRHGACPTGADLFAKEWTESWAGMTVTHEPWPAHWGLGKGAGPIRNSAMVQAGANVCLAFFGPCISDHCRIKEPHWSHGTTDCARKAKAAGIGVKPMFWQPETMPVIPKPDFL